MHPVLQIYCQKTAGTRTPAANRPDPSNYHWWNSLSAPFSLDSYRGLRPVWSGGIHDYSHITPPITTGQKDTVRKLMAQYGRRWNEVPRSLTERAGDALNTTLVNFTEGMENKFNQKLEEAKAEFARKWEETKKQAGEFAGKAAPWAAGATGLALLIYMMSQQQQPTGGGTQMSMQPTGWGPQLPALGMGAYTMNQQQQPPVNQPVMQPPGWEPQLPKEDTRAYR